MRHLLVFILRGLMTFGVGGLVTAFLNQQRDPQ